VGGERFLSTLTRSAIVAGILGVLLLLVLPRHAGVLSDYVDTFSVAFCFTFLGYYIDALVAALPEIDVGVGRLVRVAAWFAGGLWCYVVARWLWTHYGRDANALPRLLWGGVLLVALELARHAAEKARGRPSFYD
jgi:hypothetical protein